MSGPTSTSPISMRAYTTTNNNNSKKQQRGLFKGWKKNTTNNTTTNKSSVDRTIPKYGEPGFQEYLNQMAQQQQQQQQVSPNRSYNNNHQQTIATAKAPQFSPSLRQQHAQKLTPPQIQQNYPTGNDEYYHYCNDELSRQLQLAAQKDKQLNEERRMVKIKFRERHCAPSGHDGQFQLLQHPPLTQVELQQKWQNLQQRQQQKQQQQQRSQKQHGSTAKQQQGRTSTSKLSRLKEDLQTQSTHTTKDTASSSSASHTSSLTNNTTPGNAVTDALSTAAQVFHQEQSGHYTTTTTAVAAAAGGGEKEYVQDWTPLSDSFMEQSTTTNGNDDFVDWHIDNETPTPPRSSIASWREAVDSNSGKTYYYNVRTKEVSWTIPEEQCRSKTLPPPPPPPSNNNDGAIMQMVKTPHRDNTSGMQQQKKQQQQQIDERKKKQQSRRRVHKSPPRARASPSLDSIAEDDDDDDDYSNDQEAVVDDDDDDESDDENSEDAVDTNNINLPPSQQHQQSRRRRRIRSKSPFRVISRSQSPPLLRHASSSFHSDPNRGDDPDGVGSVGPVTNNDNGGRSSSGRKSISPFRVFQNKSTTKKKKEKKPVVNMMPPSLQRRGQGSSSGEVVGDVVSLVSYYDDPSIGALSSLDDTTLASRSFPKRAATPSVEKAGTTTAAVRGEGISSERRDTGSSSSSSGERRDASRTTPPRQKKHADPPGNSIDEIFHQKKNEYSLYSGSRDPSRSPYRRERQQQRRLPDPSPMRQQQQQQQVHHSPYQLHQSSYSRQSPQRQQRSPYKHEQQQQQHAPPYTEIEQEHRSPYSGQHPPYVEETQQERSPYSDHQEQYLQQPQIFVDEDGNQWMVTPQEAPRQHVSLQPRSQQLKNNHRQQPKPRQIYYDEEGQPYYYEEDDYNPEQQLQHQEHSMPPPPELQTPRQGWQWSDQKGPTHPGQYPDQGDYPAEEEYFVDGKGNFISFITPDPEEGDNNVLDDFESIGMLTGDEEGPPLEGHNGTADDYDDDTTAANTLNTVDLVAEVKRVWRHVQRYEQKKSMKAADSRIEKKDSEEELLVHQFSQAFVQASPGRANLSGAASMTRSNAGASVAKSSTAGVSTMTPSTTQRSTKDAAQISPEKEVVSSASRGRSRSKDSRLGEHIRSTSVHSRALSSRGDSPATGSDYAMMSHGDTEMDGAFISEGMDAFFLSPGKQQTSTLKQQAQQKQHLLHPSQVAAAQKLMQNNKAAISAASKQSSKAPSGAQEHDLASPYDFNKVKSTGTNFSQKTQTISNTTNSNAAMKAYEFEKARKQNELTDRSPPRPPNSRSQNVNHVQIQQREEERKEAVSPGSMYRMALKSAKDRKSRRE